MDTDLRLLQPENAFFAMRRLSARLYMPTSRSAVQPENAFVSIVMPLPP